MILKKLALAAIVSATSLFSSNLSENEAWELAYQIDRKNFLEAHEFSETYYDWPHHDLHDCIFRELYNAYGFYKAGFYHEAHQLFAVIDQMIKLHIEDKESDALSIVPPSKISGCPILE